MVRSVQPRWAAVATQPALLIFEKLCVKPIDKVPDTDCYAQISPASSVTGQSLRVPDTGCCAQTSPASPVTDQSLRVMRKLNIMIHWMKLMPTFHVAHLVVKHL